MGSAGLGWSLTCSGSMFVKVTGCCAGRCRGAMLEAEGHVPGSFTARLHLCSPTRASLGGP